MKLLESIAVVVVGVAVLALVTVVMLAPDRFERLFASIGTVNIALRAAAMLVLNAMVLLLMYLRVRGRAVPIDGLVVQAQGALANVEVESARAIVLSAVNNVPDVASAEATIRAVHGRADIQMDVNIAGNTVNIPQKQKEINRVLRQVINKQLGLRMQGRPRVNIRLGAPATTAQISTPSAPSDAESTAPQIEKNVVPEPQPAPETVKPEAVEPSKPDTDPQAPLSLGSEPSENALAADLSPSESSESGLNDNWLRSYLRGDKDEKDN